MILAKDFNVFESEYKKIMRPYCWLAKNPATGIYKFRFCNGGGKFMQVILGEF